MIEWLLSEARECITRWLPSPKDGEIVEGLLHSVSSVISVVFI
jgi:hypothetical protein